MYAVESDKDPSYLKILPFEGSKRLGHSLTKCQPKSNVMYFNSCVELTRFKLQELPLEGWQQPSQPAQTGKGDGLDSVTSF